MPQLCCRRKQREAKKHNKQIQAERQKEKAQAKKSSIEAVTKLRKQRQKSGFAGELDMDAELASMDRSRSNNTRRITQSESPWALRLQSRNAHLNTMLIPLTVSVDICEFCRRLLHAIAATVQKSCLGYVPSHSKSNTSA